MPDLKTVFLGDWRSNFSAKTSIWKHLYNIVKLHIAQEADSSLKHSS